jgi:hypothetical protein
VCDRCLALKGKTATTECWLAEHATHGDKTVEAFPHPSGTWFWRVCPCGAKHLSAKEFDDGKATQIDA